MADDAPTFLKRINDSDVGQLLSLAANFSGTVQGLLGVISLFQQSDDDKILSAIQQLQQDLENDFKMLGDLIAQQTQIIVNTINRDTMALALSRTDIATSRIQEFLSTNDSAALEAAKTESIGGVSFFTELGLTSPDLSFFLPGIVKAGMMRIFVIASEPLSLREPPAVVTNDVNLMITYLSTMIDSVKRTVDAAHTVSQQSHTVPCPAIPAVTAASTGTQLASRIVRVIDGYTHEEDGVQLQFFDAQGIDKSTPCDQPSGLEQKALDDAVQARNQGVSDELAFLGIPAFEQILQQWRNLLAS